MTRERKEAPCFHGDWMALVPYRFQKAEPICGRPVLVTLADKDEQQRFYKALLNLPRLSPKVRAAVLAELGMPSPQKEKASLHRARALAYRWNIKQDMARMRENGEKPRGGIGEAAMVHEAQRLGMTVSALKQYLHRHAPTTKRRRTSRALAALAK
jgi:hypothetical protein